MTFVIGVGSAVKIWGEHGFYQPLLRLESGTTRDRLNVAPESIGLVISKEFFWDDNWYKVLFPEGVGYCRSNWLVAL